MFPIARQCASKVTNILRAELRASFATSSSVAMKAKKFIYATPYQGEPKQSNFQLVEEELPSLKENGM